MNNFNNQSNLDQTNLNNRNNNQEPNGIVKMVGQCLPFAPLLFEQFTGQKLPQISGTMAEIQGALQQIITNLQIIVNNQQQLAQRLNNLEQNASQQFTNLVQQVNGIKSIRLSHEKRQIDYNLQPENQP